MPDTLKEIVTQAWNRNVIVAKQYICEDGKSKSGVCKECKKYRDKIFEWPADANRMPSLPIHPNCLCHYKDLTLSDVRTCAWKERQKILEITAEENKIQSKKFYNPLDACGTQADELAGRLHLAHFVFWFFRVLHGAPFSKSETFFQHHVVSVHPVPPNPYEAFILDTWNGYLQPVLIKEKDISGGTSVETWKKGTHKYFHTEEESTQELNDIMNRYPERAKEIQKRFEKMANSGIFWWQTGD